MIVQYLSHQQVHENCRRGGNERMQMTSVLGMLDVGVLKQPVTDVL